MRTTTALLTLGIAFLAAALTAGAIWTQGALALRETRLSDLSREVTRLRAAFDLVEEERVSLAERLETLEQERDAAREALALLRKTVDESMVPREVGSTADFPVQRGMAQAGDSAASFAAREGTTLAVLKALNPWLDESKPFQAYQTLWIPKVKKQ